MEEGSVLCLLRMKKQVNQENIPDNKTGAMKPVWVLPQD